MSSVFGESEFYPRYGFKDTNGSHDSTWAERGSSKTHIQTCHEFDFVSLVMANIDMFRVYEGSKYRCVLIFDGLNWLW